MATSGGGGGNREGSAKATVADQIFQAVQSTSNLLHLMQDSSPSQVILLASVIKYIAAASRAAVASDNKIQAHLIKLPKNLLVKASTIKNTGQVLEQLPQVISSLDAYLESSLQSAPHLKTVTQLLSNMETSQLRSAFPPYRKGEAPKDSNSEKNC